MAKTNLHQAIDSIEQKKARYDQQVKELLSDIQVLSRIVKYTIPDVAHLSIEEIIACIDQDSVQVGETFVDPGLTNANLGKAKRLATEDSVPNEGYITYDIRFSLYYKEKELKILLNVEVQQLSKSQGYQIENRAQFYLARMISSQKNVEFTNSDYDNIKKCYSIWLLLDANNNEDSIVEVTLQARTIFGKAPKFPELNKMNAVFIQLRKNRNVKESKHQLISMLEDLLANEDKEIKKQKLRQKHHMILEQEGRFDEMCNLSDFVYEQGIEEGEARGLKLGEERGRSEGLKLGEKRGEAQEKRSVITKLLKNGMSVEAIAEILEEPLDFVKKIFAEQSVAR